MPSTHYYSVFGFTIESELLLANLPAAVNLPSDKTAVCIHFGNVSKTGLKHPIKKTLCTQTDRENFWLNIPFTGRFLVENGSEITIDPDDESDEDSLNAFLLTLCFEALLKQRGLQVMSGFSLNMDEQGIAFTGTQGFAATLLLLAFFKRKYAVINSHFICTNETGNLLPGIAQIEISPDHAMLLGIETQALKKLRPEVEKYILPLNNQYCLHPLRLNTLYQLQKHDKQELKFMSADDGDNIIRILLPAGLKLQHLADSIEKDRFTRKNYAKS